MKPRYYIRENYPFQKYELYSLVFPTKKELEEFKKFPRVFEDKTIRYKVLKRDSNGNILKVKCLKNNRVFQVGENVIYTLSHLKYYCAFTISGFKELNDKFNNFIYVCFNSIEHDNEFARACGLSLIEHLRDKTKYNKIEYLK